MGERDCLNAVKEKGKDMVYGNNKECWAKMINQGNFKNMTVVGLHVEEFERGRRDWRVGRGVGGALRSRVPLR
jgi:hypothetical protein